MKHTDPTERSQLQQEYLAELKALENSTVVAVQIPSIAIIAIIGNIQLASRHPEVGDSPVTRIAIDAARKLQSVFDPESAIYKVLELGWKPDEDLLVRLADGDDEDEDYIDDDEHNFSGTAQLCRQDYPEDEEMSDEDAIALYGDNYGPVVKETDPRLKEAIKKYFEREGIDLDDCDTND